MGDSMAGAQGAIRDEEKADREFRRFMLGLGRGAAGAMLFGIPMLMTMELWALGFSVERTRLLLMLVINIPMLIVLADLIGFERTTTWQQALRDATIAYALGTLISAVLLVMLGIIKTPMPFSEMLGKTAIQAIPASIGAMLGRSQLGGADDDDGDDDAVPDQLSTRYIQELFLMAVGALFLNLNVAPTEEIILISYKMTPWHALATILVSLGIMHGFVYAVAFKGTHAIPDGIPWWHAFVRFTLPGYVISMVISVYVLWTFGRLDDTAFTQILMSAIVLSFPGAIGAAAARLIL
jgi:putative integral membrane protein (TIGR02587 family)